MLSHGPAVDAEPIGCRSCPPGRGRHRHLEPAGPAAESLERSPRRPTRRGARRRQRLDRRHGRAARGHFPDVDVVPPRPTRAGPAVRRGHREPLASSPDLVWLMDDDTVPEPTARWRGWWRVGAVRAGRPGAGGQPGRVDRRPGPPDEHTPPQPGLAEEARGRRPRSGVAHPVGVLRVGPRRRRRVRERGLPVADYFLWNDDFEFTTRLIRGRVGLYCPRVVVHKTRTFGSTDADPGERFFFEVRNKVWLFTRSPRRSTRWRRAVRRTTATPLGDPARSQDRRTLLRGLGRGIPPGSPPGPARPTRSSPSRRTTAGRRPAGVAESRSAC